MYCTLPLYTCLHSNAVGLGEIPGITWEITSWVGGGRGERTLLNKPNQSCHVAQSPHTITLPCTQSINWIIDACYWQISDRNICLATGSPTSTILKLTSPGTSQSFPCPTVSLSLILTTTGGKQLAIDSMKYLEYYTKRGQTHTHAHTQKQVKKILFKLLADRIIRDLRYIMFRPAIRCIRNISLVRTAYRGLHIHHSTSQALTKLENEVL